MPRNSASGANRQRRRPRNGNSENDGRRRFKTQPGQSDPNIRLDGQSKEQSFAQLERTREPTRVVGVPGWKGEENEEVPKNGTTTQDDVWKHFWGDHATPTATTLPHSSNPSQITSPAATLELSKNHPLIPKSSSVVVGKSVDIVLKQDQGTGRTVNGVISQVLSRGDHPWGIKVKLKDGSVGRVQKVH
jgi:uncharacterized repeat protein (TIGR03833 family)